MARRLAANISSDYVAAANKLKPNKSKKTVVVFVESYARSIKAGVDTATLCLTKKLGNKIKLQQRFTACNGDAAILIKTAVLFEFSYKICNCHFCSCISFPRIGVVTEFASQGTALHKDNKSNTWTVERAETLC